MQTFAQLSKVGRMMDWIMGLPRLLPPTFEIVHHVGCPRNGRQTVWKSSTVLIFFVASVDEGGVDITKKLTDDTNNPACVVDNGGE